MDTHVDMAQKSMVLENGKTYNTMIYMKSKYLILAISLFSLMFISCNSSKKINNVRELMEDAGWEYVQRVNVDLYHESTKGDNYIFEDDGEYDLFKRGNDYALTRHDTDKIPLDGYETGDESLKASTWINHFAYPGNYTIRAKHAKKGTGLLGITTKHYNARTNGGIYFNINTSVVDTQSSEITEEDSVPADVMWVDTQSSEITEVGNDATTENIEEISEPEPQKKFKQCPLCYGSGRCGGCGGSGSVYNAIDYDPGQYVDCGACGGTGRCGLCEGSGMVEDFGW